MVLVIVDIHMLLVNQQSLLVGAKYKDTCEEDDRQAGKPRVALKRVFFTASSKENDGKTPALVSKHRWKAIRLPGGHCPGMIWHLVWMYHMEDIPRKGRVTERPSSSRARRIIYETRLRCVTSFLEKNCWSKRSQGDRSLCIPRDAISKAPH